MTSDSHISGIILIDKPKGISSFDCIRVLRKKLAIKKMGHAGTLDPEASGLMIIGVGNSTKDLEKYLKLDKSYQATILFGEKTDTGDSEGKILESVEVTSIDNGKLESEVATMVGKLDLPVPRFSAIKQGGEPLYKKARRGDSFEVPFKEMIVRGARLVSFCTKGNRSVAVVDFEVSSGTYVRSLAEELGKRMGLPARLDDLRRTSIGDFKVEDAKKLDEVDRENFVFVRK